MRLKPAFRNLVAHFSAKRFPEDDAFLFIAKSETDFKKQFLDAQSDSNLMLTAIVDGPVLQGSLAEVEGLQIWLAKHTAISVKQAHETNIGARKPRNGPT